MLTSMTGFGSQTTTITIDNTPVTLNITIKTLNGRFFENSCKMPSAFSAYEIPLSRILKKELVRGSVYCTIYSTKSDALKGSITGNTRAVSQYLDAIRTIQKETNLSGQVNVADILKLPNIFETEERVCDESVQEQLSSALRSVIKDVINERQKEGAQLEIDIKQRVERMNDLIDKIEPQAKKVFEEKQKEIAEKQAKIENEEIIEYDLSALYNQLDKLDVNEEIVRFRTHLKNLKKTIDQKEPQEKGKKLDFILQELFRETSTLAAKCCDANINTNAISIKVELEKLREQAQNIL